MALPKPFLEPLDSVLELENPKPSCIYKARKNEAREGEAR